MADWTFTTSDALASETWGDRWWKSAKDEAYFYGNGYVGKVKDTPYIVEMDELESAQGYQHTFGQVRNLSGAGVTGDSAMEDNEESPTEYDDQVVMSQKRNAIRTAGMLSEQFKSDKHTREWAKDLLKGWMADTLDQDIFTALGTSPTKVIYPGSATSTATITNTDYFTLSLISACVAYARKATPRIVGKKMNGKRRFACVVSPDQAFDLSERDASWSQAQREAQRPGNDNPIFTEALGMHKNTVIQDHSRVATVTNWGSGANLDGATALFMGVGAGAIAYAKRNLWNEKTFDYKNKVGFCIGKQYGVTKAVFNSADNALVAIRTFRSDN